MAINEKIVEMKKKLDEVLTKFEQQISEFDKEIAKLKAENAELLEKQNEGKEEEKISTFRKKKGEQQEKIYILPDSHRLPMELLCELAKFVPWKGVKGKGGRGRRGQIGRRKKKNHADLLLANSHLTSFLRIRFSARNKKTRKRKSAAQKAILENCFAMYRYVCPKDREQLARQLGLTEKQVKVWFQNRRRKEREQWHAAN